MTFLLLLIVVLYASSAWGQDFVCGFDPALESESYQAVGARGHSPADYQSGTIRPIILFGTFNGVEGDSRLTRLLDREGERTQSAANLLSGTHEGSLAHYFNAMSYRKLILEPGPNGVDLNWYESNKRSVSNYITVPTGKKCKDLDNSISVWHDGIRTFVEEVIQKADASTDFSHVDYDKNTNGMVDLVAIITPRDFGDECGSQGTVFYNLGLPMPVDGITNIEVVITSDHRSSFPFLVGVLAHEYGHVMGLPELFDRDRDRDFDGDGDIDNTDRMHHSAGIGRWGVMGLGAEGWPHVADRSSGPNPMSAWSRLHVGWITPEPVNADRLEVQLRDINSSSTGEVFQIPVRGSSEEYFLVANRQNGYPTVGSYYDDLAPASGLAIWHVDENAGKARDVNKHEKHKRVDLECADGLFSDRGHPSTSPDAVTGGDNLDYWSRDNTYTNNHNGNWGDATDVWDGSSYGAFTPYTNPSTAGYEPAARRGVLTESQNVFSGIYIENISKVAGQTGVMTFDVRFAPLAPNALDAAVGEDQVELNWEEPSPNGATIASYNVRHRLSTETDLDWTKTSLKASARTHTVTGLAKDEYTFEVLAVSAMQETKAGKEGDAARITVSPQLAIDGPDSVKFPEIPDNADAWDRRVASYRKSGSFTWSLEGMDAAQFELMGTGGFRELYFKKEVPPNFEDPHDTPEAGADRGDNIYHVTVKADPAGASGQAHHTRYRIAVRVEVTNVDERGTVTLTDANGTELSSMNPPRVGEELTATLTDPDGNITVKNWIWWREMKHEDTGYTYPVKIGGAITSTYAPVEDDIGLRLQARVQYTDGHIDNREPDKTKNGSSAWTASVVGLVIEGPTDVRFDEVVSTEVPPPLALETTYTATAPEGTTVEWSLIGADREQFNLVEKASNASNERTLQGTLQFRQPPNFEAPVDADTDNVYAVSVVASDGTLADTLAVTVAITNAEDEGTVVLSRLPPQVGVPLTAVLKDEDGPGPHGVTAEPRWQWYRFVEGEWWFFSTAGPPWTPPASHVGFAVQVAALYVDGHGTEVDTTWSVPTAPIVAAANQPPVVSGEQAPSVDEQTTTVGAYTATDADNDPLTWQALAGADASLFAWTGASTDSTRSLQFQAAPNYEAPVDANTDNVYEVSLVVGDGTATTPYPVKVQVVDVAEPPGVPTLTHEVGSSRQGEYDETHNRFEWDEMADALAGFSDGIFNHCSRS